jgi:hypothetical protein
MANTLLIVLICFLLLTGLTFAQNLSGSYTLSSQGTTLTLILEQDNQGNIKGTLSSTTGAQYRVEGMIYNNVGVGTCVSNQGGSYFEAHPKGNELLFALIEPDANNKPDYSKIKQLLFTKKDGMTLGQQGAQAIPGEQGRQPQAPPPGAGSQLMQQMAAVYYSFSSAGLSYSGGTERRVTLCPDGTYYSGSESSYSAGAGTAGAWGTASQQADRGTWRVQGNINQGLLTTIDSSGKPTEYRYQRCGGDCIYIGNTKFAIAGPANCR